MKHLPNFRAAGCAALLLTLAVPCPADEPAARDEAAAAAPRIEFSKSGHDFGVQESGADLHTSFEFKNTGDAVLRILKVKGG